MEALLLNFRHQGKKAIEKVARNQPGVYLKILALLVPRELKVEQNQGVKAMSDEQLEAAIEAVKAMLEQRAGEAAKVIEGTAETVALPAPDVVPDGPNKVKMRRTQRSGRRSASRKGATCHRHWARDLRDVAGAGIEAERRCGIGREQPCCRHRVASSGEIGQSTASRNL
jgi:hypothetical protein